MQAYSYETLTIKAHASGIDIAEKTLRGSNKGLYGDGMILIDKRITTIIEKACILAEELGHHYTSSGNILDQRDIRNRKQELLSRHWAYDCMLPLDRIVEAHHNRIAGRYELAEYLSVTEEFLQNAIDRFSAKYGLTVKADDHHVVVLDPLGVIEVV
ncbi:ImmA/IrrE family metallo-endopeptidase [Paenibacillus xylanilyticus]|uniref:ImmA/IrrE family metallo-endopeptidase n=1 Tax=Paenibacillus xylanilyticus TaxID=248903 RepID=UPI00129D393E|nr:ImmA/IrrE family metallo-endopeptidase [Paenibacillus xylanilyticus]